VPALADVQRRIRNALVEGSGEHALPLLLGGRHPGRRLAIHQRHYEASLVEALVGKFPACIWLVGGALVTEAARAFARAHPPTAPCIAEYGAGFPEFLARRREALRFPYLQSFAEFEWHLGHMAIAIELPPTGMDALADLEPDVLPDVVLKLQPGVRYFAAAWPVDELIAVFLADNAPERFEFEPAPVALELQGARGTFNIKRLDAGTFAFRLTITDGNSIGAAAERAFEADPSFDPGRALALLFGENLVTAVIPPNVGAPS
jgi:hypothetical protein